ncbi:DUF6443 domain-containing protein [Flavivirga eckloniae]|uniref:Uncharacterized protein n=1 Tax=Flavivirga eckloniae TaxID=1803846 RepID=A0A2K9PSL6_9FLAO|nr:polymorphic toxin type 23 domain-containing protein [Flavivirga eckloniae]AUP79808.1 hypothetical protein C1H87_14280 [Flavivirga eckloniae]
MFNNCKCHLEPFVLGIIIFLCFVSALNAQYTINGLTNVDQYQTENYYISGPSYSDIYWNIDHGGTITGPSTGANTSVQWTGTSTGKLLATVIDTNSNAHVLELSVTITGADPPPSAPGTPTVSGVCEPVLTRAGSPPSGVTWYWQGKNANGTSTAKNSSTPFLVDEGSGVYYIRAINSNGVWSNNSGSVEVYADVSKPLWYTDVDNDGLGDPASPPISSCTQPTGRVSNNFDQCPTQSGTLLNNGCAGSGDLGSTDKNYVHTVTPLIAVSNVSQITNNDDKIESVTYFDGLGRTIQNVGIRAGGQRQDIKTPSVYDEFGKQTKTYLPHATVTSSVTTYTNNTTIINDLNTYYVSKYSNQLNGSNPNPYAEKRFDNSPLNRALETGTPGEDWLINPNSDNDHTTKYDYNTNSTDEVYNIDYPGTGQPLSISNYYTEGVLLKNTFKNENWVTTDGKVNTKDVFTDNSGKKIAEYSYIKESVTLKTLKTHYVYDNSGNLIYVLTPKIFSIISGSTISVTNLNNLAFQYKYDIYNRQIEQKVPGKKQWEYMVYDQLDRPILTQDKNLKDDGKWLFTKYDAFGRAVYSGLYTSSLTRDQLQTAVDTYIIGNTTNLSNIESRALSATNIGGININYSNNAYPTTNLEVLTVNYFDDYTFTDSDKPATPASILGQVVTTKTKGLLASSWAKTLGASSWAKNYMYYDDKGRVINIYEKNYLGGYTLNKSKLDFSGKIKASLTEHKRTSADTPLIIKDYFTYDHVERPLSHTQSLGGDNNTVVEDMIVLDDLSSLPNATIDHVAFESITIKPGFIALPGFSASIEVFDRELISYNTYDELGQLINKKVGGEAEQVIANSTGLQTMDYNYDVRGSLKGVNDVDNIVNDLFAYELNYESGEGTNFNAPQYNGNISQMVWKSGHNNTKKSYFYDYDDLNRFKKGRYGEGAGLTTNWQKFEVNVNGYDHNGNITGLTRRGSSSGTTIDNLAYHYDTGSGNQLMRITDTSTSEGFKNGTNGGDDYAYDDNGNLTKDLNKGISLIEYNHLDLVTKVTFTNTSKIEFVYDAFGVKLKMTYTPNGGSATTTDYIGGFQYTGGTLQFFPTPEGYIENDNGNYTHVYSLKDHLGNNRITFKDTNNDGIVTSGEILSSTDYYPMGLTHYGEYVQNSNYNYKYQNKEQLLANGYNMYDFGSRMYDASVGRWFNTDPQNQFGSPYLAMGNNWVVSVDPNGEFAQFIIAGAFLGIMKGIHSNQVNGKDPYSNIGGIAGSAGKGALNGLLFGMNGVIADAIEFGTMGKASVDIPVFKNFSLSLSPAFAFGSSQNSIGLNLTANYEIGDFTLSASATGSFTNKAVGTGKSGFGGVFSGGGSYDDGNTGFSLYSTYYTNVGGVGKQRVGGLGFRSGDFRFRYENDGFPFGGTLGDGNDSYRSAAAGIGVGNYSVGFNLFTGSRSKSSYEGDKDEKKRARAIDRYGDTGFYGERYPNGFVNETGTAYRLGALYFGFKNYRIGIDSDRYVRHPIQNRFAHGINSQPGFRSYSDAIYLYSQYKTSNPFSLW